MDLGRARPWARAAGVTGTAAGGGVLVGGAVVGAGLPLPEGTLLRRAALTVGTVPGALGRLTVPVWFLRLGRVPAGDVAGSRRPHAPESSSRH